MNADYPTGADRGEDVCVVCGKGLRPGEALARLPSGTSKLPICCPLCLEAYQQDPTRYLEQLARQTLLQELRRSMQTPQRGGSCEQ